MVIVNSYVCLPEGMFVAQGSSLLVASKTPEAPYALNAILGALLGVGMDLALILTIKDGEMRISWDVMGLNILNQQNRDFTIKNRDFS